LRVRRACSRASWSKEEAQTGRRSVTLIGLHRKEGPRAAPRRRKGRPEAATAQPALPDLRRPKKPQLQRRPLRKEEADQRGGAPTDPPQGFGRASLPCGAARAQKRAQDLTGPMRRRRRTAGAVASPSKEGRRSPERAAAAARRAGHCRVGAGKRFFYYFRRGGGDNTQKHGGGGGEGGEGTKGGEGGGGGGKVGGVVGVGIGWCKTTG